mmetsp:Transcript_29667/g.76670  ORF Transcript_29667/g.76670 Transcript_29667/m.76670 type:complete len:211 (+) Transcript_29667:377-1009(+)
MRIAHSLASYSQARQGGCGKHGGVSQASGSGSVARAGGVGGAGQPGVGRGGAWALPQDLALQLLLLMRRPHREERPLVQLVRRQWLLALLWATAGATAESQRTDEPMEASTFLPKSLPYARRLQVVPMSLGLQRTPCNGPSRPCAGSGSRPARDRVVSNFKFTNTSPAMVFIQPMPWPPIKGTHRTAHRRKDPTGRQGHSVITSFCPIAD